MFISTVAIWLDEDSVPYSALLFQLERELLFPKVFISCKSTLVCVRKRICWIWVRKRVLPVSHTCSKTAWVLKWTLKRTHPQTQTGTCGRETRYLSRLCLSIFFLFFSLYPKLSFYCSCFISLRKKNVFVLPERLQLSCVQWEKEENKLKTNSFKKAVVQMQHASTVIVKGQYIEK